ncbi:MAG: low molecular weight protein-tyrosine-phosphatase [Pseudomonadota bacterium]
MTLDSESQIAVLFVCMGNICRSPTAEAVFRKRVSEAGLSDAFRIDSAGTHAYHVGHPPDGRSQEVTEANGISMSGQRARRVRDEDFFEFDYVFAMDRLNLVTLQEREPDDSTAALSLLLGEAPMLDEEEVPDPYYGGRKGFDTVFSLIDTACAHILETLIHRHQLR